MAIQNLEYSSECMICGYLLNLAPDIEVGELLECGDCGTELEVTAIEPTIELIEAPCEGEDWGQ